MSEAKYGETITGRVISNRWLEEHEARLNRLEQSSLVQEPVAWMHRVDEDITEFNDFQACPKCEPLYTHPKEWQGLSDDEIEEALSGTDPNFIHGSCTQGILWAEAKLKEKNG